MMVTDILLNKTLEVAIQKTYELAAKGIRFLWKRHDDRIQRDHAAEVNRAFFAGIIVTAFCAVMLVLIAKESS